MAPLTICLVGCGKTKLSRPARAKDIYTGPLFKAAREFAEGCDGWWILSARYGLLDPQSRIEPYNMRLPSSALERHRWGLVAATGLTSRMAGLGYQVLVLAGADYADPICSVLRERGVVCKRPLEGLGIGQRLAWFKAQRIAEAS